MIRATSFINNRIYNTIQYFNNMDSDRILKRNLKCQPRRQVSFGRPLKQW